MLERMTKGGNRTLEQLKEHYEIEKELASRLRNSSKEERRSLYSSVYDELFRRVPHHGQLRRKVSPEETMTRVSLAMRFLGRFLRKDSLFLEIGAGDCSLSFEVARSVKAAYAVDVSERITTTLTPPLNFQLILSDGANVPIPRNSVNVAYSNQVMEHLHPEDAFEQIQHIYNALCPGGIYICITPNRLDGPHDISRHFDSVPTGLHLREYTALELNSLFRKVGFSKVRVYIGGKGLFTPFPLFLVRLFEYALEAMPYSLRRALALRLPFRMFSTIRIVGSK